MVVLQHNLRKCSHSVFILNQMLLGPVWAGQHPPGPGEGHAGHGGAQHPQLQDEDHPQ